jgi:ferredoxin, 2Fe-2S
MPAIHVIRRDGSAITIEAPAGRSLMRALKDFGIDEIQAICGGCASCGTCHVRVSEDWLSCLPPMRTNEDELLGFSDWRRANSRLACQIPFTDALDGIALAVAPED